MSVDKISPEYTHQKFETTKNNDQTVAIESKKEQQEKENYTVPTKKQLENITNSMNEFIQPTKTHLKFELHEKLNEYYVTVVDNQTSEVVREIPSKKLLDIYASMTEYLGIIVDKKI